MRHLKTYESEDNSAFSQLKKYVVWKMAFVFVILKVIEKNEQSAVFKRLYIYNFDTLKIRKAVKIENYNFDYDQINDHVIYQSDNLQDCIDEEYLSMLNSTTKYNL